MHFRLPKITRSNLLQIVSWSWVIFILLDYLLKKDEWIWQWFFVVPTFLFLLITLPLLLINIKYRKYFAIVALCGCLLMSFANLDYSFNTTPRNTLPLDTSQVISYLDWNTEHWQWDAQKVNFQNFLKQNQADVMTFQEFSSVTKADDGITDVSKDASESELRQLFPSLNIIQHGELITATKFPIIHSVRGQSGGFLRTDLRFGNGEIFSIYNVHIYVPSLYIINPKDVLEHPQQAFDNLHALHDIRQTQFTELFEDIASNNLPFAIAGDFNSTKWVPQIQTLLANYKDAYYSTHSGFPLTWNIHDFSMWRIDYVIGNKIKFYTYSDTYREEFSDHHMLFTQFKLTVE